MLIIFLVLSLYLVLFFIWVNWKIYKNNKMKKQQTPFECGFDPKDNARLPFSLQFFLMVILFLMFDVELSLLLQMPLMFDFGLFKSRFIFLIILLTLLMGLMEEWRRGLLKWN